MPTLGHSTATTMRGEARLPKPGNNSKRPKRLIRRRQTCGFTWRLPIWRSRITRNRSPQPSGPMPRVTPCRGCVVVSNGRVRGETNQPKGIPLPADSAMIVKNLVNVLSPAGRRGRLSILIFHRVLAHKDPIVNWDLDATEFQQTMEWLKEWFNVLPLDQAIARLNDHSLPARSAAITFDDGYADNFTVALPILQAHGLTATFFIATGYLDGGRMWNDTVIEAVCHCNKARIDLSREGLGVHELNSSDAIRQAIMSILNNVKYRDPQERLKALDYVAAVSGARLPQDLMMTSDQVKIMRHAGMSIGAHTVTHPDSRPAGARGSAGRGRREQEISGDLAAGTCRLVRLSQWKTECRLSSCRRRNHSQSRF
jgi:peptidoglycan/xylan/chitin deacetylase (PgdA/CDA1 family)